MKRLILAVSIVLSAATAQAQSDFERGIFNHLGFGVGVGTEGGGLNLAVPVTPFFELSAGVDYIPSIKPSFDVEVNDITTTCAGQSFNIPMNEVKITADAKRAMFNAKLSIYPFGNKSSFFLAGGLSFGGERLLDLTGHSDDVKAFMNDATIPAPVKSTVFAEIDKYKLQFDQNGDITGEVKVKNVRPYVGLGFGRLVPRNEIGFRVELGAQFMGKMKIYQGGEELNASLQEAAGDDLSDIIDKVKMYPVLKFTLTGRIF